MKKNQLFILVILLLGVNIVNAQDFFENDKEPVYSFRAPLVINAQTTQMPPVGGI